MKKMSRHDTASMSHPPTNGPSAPATPASPDHAPMARPRSSGWKLAEMSARLPGTRSAAPAPCTARRDEHAGVRREPARRAGDREADETGEEAALAPVEIAERAAEQQQRAQRHEVSVEDPLQLADARVEVAPDRGQRHVDDRAVEERDAGAEHRRRDDPTGGRGPEPDRARLRRSVRCRAVVTGARDSAAGPGSRT